jgi:hypothetical protein
MHAWIHESGRYHVYNSSACQLLLISYRYMQLILWEWTISTTVAYLNTFAYSKSRITILHIMCNMGATWCINTHVSMLVNIRERTHNNTQYTYTDTREHHVPGHARKTHTLETATHTHTHTCAHTYIHTLKTATEQVSNICIYVIIYATAIWSR